MKEKFLPIGTVCLLKGGQKNLMIIGYCPQAEKDGNLVRYDYVGCLYPEGLISSDQNLVFNHDNIDKIIKEVEVEPDTDEFLKKLRALMFAVDTGAINIDQLAKDLEKKLREQNGDLSSGNAGGNNNNVISDNTTQVGQNNDGAVGTDS